MRSPTVAITSILHSDGDTRIKSGRQSSKPSSLVPSSVTIPAPNVALPEAGLRTFPPNETPFEQQLATRSSSACFVAPASPFVFCSESLPRTSSLLPPPSFRFQLNSSTIQQPPASANIDAFIPTNYQSDGKTQNKPEPPRPRQSRSSSIGGLGDSFRNLNRWSNSTTSSRASNIASFTRRMSVDVLGFGSPRTKVQINRVSSTSSTSPRSIDSRSRSRSLNEPAPPFLGLPEISSGPSLEQQVKDSQALASDTKTVLAPLAIRSSDGLDFYRNGLHMQPGAPLNQIRSGLETSRPPLSPPATRAMAPMPYQQNGEAQGHSRNRFSNAQGSNDSTSSTRSQRVRKTPSQKTMLSKALQKANMAVQFDNTAEFEDARTAYGEACDLLQQVLVRTSGEEDRKKLEAIQKTYKSRIGELDELLPQPKYDKALPQRPRPDEQRDMTHDAAVEPATAMIGVDVVDAQHIVPSYSAPIPAARRQYGVRTPSRDLDAPQSTFLSDQYLLQSGFSKSPRNCDSQNMPPPLSPRRPRTPSNLSEQGSPGRTYRHDSSTSSNNSRLAPSSLANSHRRGNSHESISWLDPIDESGGSTASSVHSRSSSVQITRKHNRVPSGDTEAEFEAALEDAIEAAYNDRYETVENSYGEPEDAVSRTRNRIQLARGQVQQTEHETLHKANEREHRLRQLQEEEERAYEEMRAFYDGNDSEEEEERLLYEMTRGSVDTLGLTNQFRPSVPRESDSSGLKSRTWHSSTGSNPPTATSVLTTLSADTIGSRSGKPPGALPPPTQALPKLPHGVMPGVRSRRMSGQNLKQLKIHTNKYTSDRAPASSSLVTSQPRAGGYIVQQRQALKNGPYLTRQVPHDSSVQDGEGRPRSPSAQRPRLRKNLSTSSLRSTRTRNLSISNLEDASDGSTGTPLSNSFAATRPPAVPALSTPAMSAFKQRMNNSSTGGLYLFESDFHTPQSPEDGNLEPFDLNAPAPLEPCPSETSLRPFWLMRCLYQTLCHSRGGYLSNKLFVPRDVWRVKNVKLKSVEDKIANCDYLTAALQKLARVDTLDADAVLEEMQVLEGVFEYVQVALSRKLGNEVGVQGVGSLFKDAAVAVDEAIGAHGAGGVPRSMSVGGGKNMSGFSWRRLRSKNSSAALINSYGSKGGSGGKNNALLDGSADGATMASLPMTAHPTNKPAKRDVSSVTFGGINTQYMSSLARLFDAAQTIDQIARQVGDPGLRHADKTQVGLELCTRHAAEFFGFYICRFVMTDLMLMLDKFIKRGTEWVLS